MAQRPTSGWENPDGHKGIERRPRPMFDAAGNAVDSAPEPEPLTPAERAMFAAVEAGADRATAVATGLVAGELADHLKALDAETARESVIDAPVRKITDLRSARWHARITELATTALDNPMPAAWAVALGEILRELDA